MPYPYYPAEAKQLLAQAGFQYGIDLTSRVHAPIRHVAEAISGELRKVGIRTKLEPLPLMVYVKKRGAGEFTAFNGFYPTSADLGKAHRLGAHRQCKDHAQSIKHRRIPPRRLRLERLQRQVAKTHVGILLGRRAIGAPFLFTPRMEVGAARQNGKRSNVPRTPP